MNTLTEEMIQGVAEGIDRATATAAVRAIVLRGAGRTLTSGYDLDAWREAGGTPSPYDAPAPELREGAWDPVRDYQSMGHNVRRFMKKWECPKPVMGQIHGWAIGGATDLMLCCDLLYMAEDAFIGYAPSRLHGTPTTMLWVYRLALEHAKQFLLSGDAIDAATAHRIGLVSHVVPPGEIEVRIEAQGLRPAVAERDAPHGDYGARPKKPREAADLPALSGAQVHIVNAYWAAPGTSPISGASRWPRNSETRAASSPLRVSGSMCPPPVSSTSLEPVMFRAISRPNQAGINWSSSEVTISVGCAMAGVRGRVSNDRIAFNRLAIRSASWGADPASAAMRAKPASCVRRYSGGNSRLALKNA